VRETWGEVPASAYGDTVPHRVNPAAADLVAIYRADFDRAWTCRTLSPLFMPRWASRITLGIDDVRVQRVQEISEEDARDEGVPPNWAGELSGFDPDLHGYLSYSYMEDEEGAFDTAQSAFPSHWDAINGKKPGCSWAENPWCWCVTFRRVEIEAAQ
jgi:hypothetical protein